MKIHKLRTYPPEFTQSMFGNKSFELRVDDRDYRLGDYLALEEWDPETKEYSGRSIMRQVTYILKGRFGLPDNMVIMAVVVV